MPIAPSSPSSSCCRKYFPPWEQRLPFRQRPPRGTNGPEGSDWPHSGANGGPRRPGGQDPGP